MGTLGNSTSSAFKDLRSGDCWMLFGEGRPHLSGVLALLSTVGTSEVWLFRLVCDGRCCGCGCCCIMEPIRRSFASISTVGGNVMSEALVKSRLLSRECGVNKVAAITSLVMMLAFENVILLVGYTLVRRGELVGVMVGGGNLLLLSIGNLSWHGNNIGCGRALSACCPAVLLADCSDRYGLESGGETCPPQLWLVSPPLA
jgi:hypothetical protein